MNAKAYDRRVEDLGNIVAFEHVNVWVPDQAKAISFYVTGLGLTRDPYMTVGLNNMWVNVGAQQFHLPTRGIQRIPGHIGLVLPDIEALKKRLEAVETELEGTEFSWHVTGEQVELTGPWGNHFRCHAPGPEFGDMNLGLAYVEFLVPVGSAQGIGKFYRSVMQAPVSQRNGTARVRVGRNQQLVFKETSEKTLPYDGHHIAVYIANFSKAHAFLLRHDLIVEESNAHQYRFKDIVDPGTGKKLFQLEHEVRSLYHPLLGRPFVNRNPSQTLRGYMPGQDAYYPS